MGLSEAHASRDEALCQVTAPLVCNRNLPSGGQSADIEVQEQRIADFTQFIEVSKHWLSKFPSQRELWARAFGEKERKCTILKAHIRSLVEPH